MELSVVMPCLNEAETIKTCIQKALSFFEKEKITGEVIIADNGSTDGSQEIAIHSGAKVVNTTPKGYGAALKAGIMHAKGKYIIMGDADDSYDFSNLFPFVSELRNGAELVMGNRFKGGIKKGAMPFLHRYLGNPVLSFIGRLFFKIKIGDFHCGLRGFSREAILKMNLHTTGMEFASEIVVKASLYKMNITEVPIILYPDGRSRPPHLRTLRDGWRHLRFLILFSPKWLFLYPGIFIILLSFFFGIILLTKPIHIKDIVIDIHTLIVLAFSLIIGIQLVFFHYFARTFSENSELVPPRTENKWLNRVFTLERGLLGGIILFILGTALMINNLILWSEIGFNDLNPIDFVRKILAAIVPIVVGIQFIIYSFILSLINIKINMRK